MATTQPTNNRASLLAGLRTGGVGARSASGPMHAPHTAAPGGAFLVPRIVSHQAPSSYPEEENDDDLAELSANYNLFGGHPSQGHRPMTAAVDGPNNRFSQQQKGMNPNSMPFNPGYGPQGQDIHSQAQAQAMQMQMMQLEIMRLQAIQNQQYQAELMAQAQRQQQQQSLGRRASAGYIPPATAGPMTQSFDLRSATVSAQMRRANAEQQLKPLGLDEQVPMTAALGGKFGSRNTPNSRLDDDNDYIPPSTPNQTTVISGGTSLGSPMPRDANNMPIVSNSSTPSKSDSVTSWRRGGNNNSVLSGMRSVTASPSVRITPPEKENQAVPTTAPSTPSVTISAAPKSRPQPLRFNIAASQPMMPAVAIDEDSSVPAAAVDNDDATSSASSKSGGVPNEASSPTTPHSASPPLSPREEAAKKLYEGLGMGRPVPPATQPAQQQSAAQPRMVSSMPVRQPRGPPGGHDEIGPKNFASRIRQKAIGGLGMLMGARERREVVEAY